MSDHKKPMPSELRAALEKHRLSVDTPSQLADSFRHGWLSANADACAEIARLHGLLKDAQSDCDFFIKREQILECALKALADRAEIHSDLTCSDEGRAILDQARGALE